MKTKYLEFLSESRYKTHGLDSVKRTIPKMLNSINSEYKIEYNSLSDDFSIYFTNLDFETKDIMISRCELLGYFPSVFSINDVDKRPNNIKIIDDFIKYVKDYKLENNNKVYIQFESWLDEKVETPKTLYHVCRTIDLDKIKRYGISPKSKHKISYHPDRIYLAEDYLSSISIIKQFRKIKKDDYSIITIIQEDNKLLVRKDPNFDAGYYTTQNILPNWINKITNF